MARADKVASRYARAAMESVKDPKKAHVLLKELHSFSKLVDSHKELEKVLQSPLFSEEPRRQVVEDLSQKMGLSKESTRVLCVLSDSGRLSVLSQVIEHLHLLVLQSEGKISLNVESATPLDSSDRKRIEEKFRGLTNKEVEPVYAEIPGLIAGLKIRAGARAYVGTVSNWLESIEGKLVGG